MFIYYKVEGDTVPHALQPDVDPKSVFSNGFEVISKVEAAAMSNAASRELPKDPHTLRLMRDALLLRLDGFVSNPLRFATLTEGQIGELGVYRQALLDLPQQEGFPESVVIPTPPTILGG